MFHLAQAQAQGPVIGASSSAPRPARRIIHLDMDAFYASVEQRDDPALRGRPVAVGGSPQSRGVVAAASYEARAFGVRSAMPMARALRACPDLVVVRPDFARYRAVSARVMAILREATPRVEPLSLDEAYLDVTENLWGEPLATRVARELKRRIRAELDLSASAGVAPNKFLAKIASGWRKPDGLTVIAPERVESFLQKLPVEALWGVGPVTAKKLRAIGVERLVDLRDADPVLLAATVGSLAGWLVRLAGGEDPREVTPDRPWKSLSAENTYAQDLRDPERMRAELGRLAGRVAAGLQKRGLRARTVTIKVRYDDFRTVTRSHTAEDPTSDAVLIAQRSVALLERTAAATRPVRLLGVGTHGLLAASEVLLLSGSLDLEPPERVVM
jgi:DNA polymerase-4